MFEKLLTTKEVAKLLNISVASLERQRWLGRGIPYVIIGTRSVRYRENDLKTWLESATKTINTKRGGGYAG